MRKTSLILGAFMLVLAGMSVPASAEVDEAARAARWAGLKAQIFGDRTVEEDANLVSIEAPDRAADEIGRAHV